MRMDLGKSGVRVMGTWSSSTAYEKNDIVTNGGDGYISITDVPVGTALSNTAYWMQIVNGFDESEVVSAVNAWLVAHPEATTTVQDNSITDAKLVQSGGVLSEVHDIRVGADGVTYASAGDAVRGQVGQISEKTYNLVIGKITARTINASGQRAGNSATDLWAAPVEQGKTYTIQTIGTVGIVCGFTTTFPIGENAFTTYNNSRTVLSGTTLTIVAPIDGYLAFTSATGATEVQLFEGDEPKPYIPPISATDYVARKDIDAFDSVINSNILRGKTLCCCGDSITYGADMDAEGITDESKCTVYQSDANGNFTQTVGNFRKTWGWQIAERNGMTLYNAGVSGSTVQGIADKNGFSLANGRYTKLPDAIDYLLIWFGWNDTAYGTLGTITDATNESYYGGYNVVLPYLINKYPYAKIALIVPFGTDEGHRNAIRLLGNKWGIAVWDNYKGGTPLYYGKEDSVGVEQSVILSNRTKFQANGAHPNYQGHKQLADMIEQFMRSI